MGMEANVHLLRENGSECDFDGYSPTNAVMAWRSVDELANLYAVSFRNTGEDQKVTGFRVVMGGAEATGLLDAAQVMYGSGSGDFKPGSLVVKVDR